MLTPVVTNSSHFLCVSFQILHTGLLQIKLMSQELSAFLFSDSLLCIIQCAGHLRIGQERTENDKALQDTADSNANHISWKNYALQP